MIHFTSIWKDEATTFAIFLVQKNIFKTIIYIKCKSQVFAELGFLAGY